MNFSHVFAAAVVTGLLSVSAVAGDRSVPQSALNSLGLGQMKVMSDAEGLSVRGKSSNALATSVSSFTMFLFDPNSGFNASFNDADFGTATDQNAGMNAASSASTNSTASNGPFALVILFNGITWNANISAINVSGMSMGTSP